MKYVGYVELHDLPIKRDDWVYIPKGTWVKTVGREKKRAGKTYSVKVNHVSPGQGYPPGHPNAGHLLGNVEVINPTVVWRPLGLLVRGRHQRREEG
jgi:hypothetical protein